MMKILKYCAIVLLILLLSLCGLAIFSRSPYPISQIQELPAQLQMTSKTIRGIKSDDEFERSWPKLSGQIREIDSTMQALLRFGYAQGGNAEFTDEDYEKVVAARDEFLQAFSLLETNVSSDNSSLARSLLRLELDPSTAAWQRVGLPLAKFATTYKLPLSLAGAALIFFILQSTTLLGGKNGSSAESVGKNNPSTLISSKKECCDVHSSKRQLMGGLFVPKGAISNRL